MTDIKLWRENGEAKTNVEQKIILHSPSGFEWGYNGSGPSDLALNIVALFTNKETAFTLHHDFKDDFIAKMPEAGGTIKAVDILAWLDKKTIKHN